MKESEVRILFLKISNRYSSFVYDDFKVQEWMSDLEGVSLEQALANARQYWLNPANVFPPHPGIIAQSGVQKSDGRYVPNAEETRRMLEHQERLSLENHAPMPENFRGKVKLLGKSNDSSEH